MAVVAVVAAAAGALAAGLPGVTGAGGGAVTAVRIVRNTTSQSTSSTSYANLPGATLLITAPRGQRALILARFSAESRCTGGSSGDPCTVRILVDGVEAGPASGTDFAFDSSEGMVIDDLAESHSMDRSMAVGTGKHRVTVQWAVGGTPTFTLDDWSLTVERVVR
ncbi:MAG: hypothetical protein E6G67_03405 [Actinobacteria bacterium]|nr:MAG: hypothetical protein E6G67_03405 [Actinomycetota bacterium]